MNPIFKVALIGLVGLMVSCSGGKSKRGCPANDSQLGAERVLAGEGSKKPSKFKIKGMDKTYK